jgi:hypothetical protein
MNKSFVIIPVLIALSVVAGAQQKIRESVFGVSAGLSVPYNEFASNSFHYDAGFASIGPNIETEYLYWGKWVGFSSGIGFASIFFNEDDYKSEYDRVLEGFGINEVSAGNYHVLKILTGIAFRLPEIKDTEIILLLQLGAARCTHPAVTVKNSELGVINSIVRSSDISLVSNAGLKINYRLNGRSGLTLNWGLNMTRPSFHDASGTGRSFFLPVRYANINLGFVMRLNNRDQ